MLKTLVNGKIQGLFKTFECFSVTFQGKFNSRGLFKTVLSYSSTFQARLNFWFAKTNLKHCISASSHDTVMQGGESDVFRVDTLHRKNGTLH